MEANTEIIHFSASQILHQGLQVHLKNGEVGMLPLLSYLNQKSEATDAQIELIRVLAI